ncbi:MAG: S8 family serine peptidase [Acidobacteria bacterium]|nr:S8 family serine peptidase [Acidobacteriota bacterium]
MKAIVSLFLVLLPLCAQVVPGRYLVELDTPSVLEAATTAEPGSAAGLPNTLRNARTVMAGRAAIEQRATVQRQQANFRRQLEASGIQVLGQLDTLANAISVRMTATDAARLASQAGVKRVVAVYQRRALLDRAAQIHRVSQVWQALGGADNAGAGVKIGIIDTGIDPDHPAMKDATLTMPEGFPKTRREADKAVITSKIIAARSYDDLYDIAGATSARDMDGHGTGVAMSAAGAPVKANFAQMSGMAPKAFLGAYRVFNYEDGGATDDVVMVALEDALKDGMDVINMSLGSLLSSRDIDGIYQDFAKRASAAGVVIVAAAGNEGPGPMTAGAPATAPDIISVAASVNDRTFRFPVSVGGITAFGVLSDGPNAVDAISGTLVDVQKLDGDGLACKALPADSLKGQIAFILRGSCFFEDKVNNAAAAGATAALIYTTPANPRAATFTIQSATLPTIMINYTEGVAIKSSLNQGTQSARLGFNGEPVDVDSRQMASFSSRGPSQYLTIKPEITAVGQAVYTAAGRADPNSNSYNASGYIVTNGTSFSSPIVAGAVATLRGGRPGLTAAQYRSLIINGASVFTPSTSTQPFTVASTGAGLLNLENSLRSPLASSVVSLALGTAPSGNFEVSKDVAISNLGTEADQVKVEVLPRDGTVAPAASVASLTIAPGDTGTFSVGLQATGLPTGIYQGTVQLTSTIGTTLRIPYWFAVPSQQATTYTVLDQTPASPKVGQEVQLVIRVFDTTGLPVMTDQFAVRPISAGATAQVPANLDSEVPGTYLVRVKLADAGLNNTFALELGSYRGDLSIRATGGN